MRISKLPKPGQRVALLASRRALKMARSAHAYVRGNTSKFYEWLETQQDGKPPDGAPVWICGDCQTGNMGPIADAKGRVEIQIRDLDQTVIGNPAHDLIRLGLSLATASRGSDLPGVTVAKVMEQLIDGYGQALTKENKGHQHRPEVVGVVMKRAMRRSWKHLAEERIQDTHPNIPLGECFWPLGRNERNEINRLFEQENVRKLATMLRSRKNNAPVAVLDAAFWVKGCSSLGRLRYAVLLNVGKSSTRGLCLMDVKEAAKATAPRYSKTLMPRNNAVRVVEGARHLSPLLGERMLAADLSDCSVVLRELRPQDLKLELDQLTEEEAMQGARFLASVVGKAHARQMDVPTRQRWQKELYRNRSKTLDAPSWLWTSVVDLIANHETAYLEHCRACAAVQI